VNAPVKEFYSFENSAHSPLFEEHERFMDILKRDVLNSHAQCQIKRKTVCNI